LANTAISQDTSILLGTTDSVFVASGVTVASTQTTATIRGDGSGHEVLIYGTVARANAGWAISLGTDTSTDTGEIVTIAEGGQVRSFAFEAIKLLATSVQVTNNGLVASTSNAIFLGAGSVANSGTIEAGFAGITRVGWITRTCEEEMVAPRLRDSCWRASGDWEGS
jgi:hypothetical protein